MFVHNDLTIRVIKVANCFSQRHIDLSLNLGIIEGDAHYAVEIFRRHDK